MKTLPFHPYSTPRVRLVTVEQSWVVAEGLPVTHPSQASALLAPYFATKDREHLVVLHLDSAHRLISAEVVSVGTLSSTPVHPREVFKAAILANARSIIVAHNHPSGDPTPSQEDHSVFDKLKQAGSLLNIPVLDFLVIVPGGFCSLNSQGGAT